MSVIEQNFEVHTFDAQENEYVLYPFTKEACIVDLKHHVNVASVTIPRGRMRGDANGDGKVDSTDSTLILRYATSGKGLEPGEQLKSADMDQNGSVDATDSLRVGEILSGSRSLYEFPEVTGNWTASTEEQAFYTDIPLEGVAEDTDVMLVFTDETNIHTYWAERTETGIRFYAAFCPIEAITIPVLCFSGGSGSAWAVQGNLKFPQIKGLVDDMISAYDGTSTHTMYGSYIGTGTYGSSAKNTLRFDRVPSLMLLWPESTAAGYGVSDLSPAIFMWMRTTSLYNGAMDDDHKNIVTYTKTGTYSGRVCYWYSETSAAVQFNTEGAQYCYLAIFPELETE